MVERELDQLENLGHPPLSLLTVEALDSQRLFDDVVDPMRRVE